MKPGAFYALFHVNADQVMDHMIPFRSFYKELHADRETGC